MPGFFLSSTMPTPLFTMPGAAPPLAQPTFFTGPSDTLATVDAYTAAGGVVNAISDVLSNLGIVIPDILKGGAALASLLPIATGIANGTLIANPAALLSRVLASSSQLSAAFPFASSAIQSSLTVGLSAVNAVQGAVGTVEATVNGVVTQVESSVFSAASQVASLVTSFAGNATAMVLNDVGAVASVASGLVGQVLGLGIPNAFGVVTLGITDPNVLKQTAQFCLPAVIAAGDAQSLISMGGVLTTGSLGLMNPTAVSNFASSYSRSKSVGGSLSNSPSNDTQTYTSAMSGFAAVNPTWNSCSRNGVPSGDISSLTGASSDFNSVVSNATMGLPPGSPDQDFALAGVYGQTDVMSSLAESFPRTVLTTGSSSAVNQTVDPTNNNIVGLITTSTTTTTTDGVTTATGGGSTTTYAPVDTSPVVQLPIDPTTGIPVDPYPHNGYRDNRMIWDTAAWGPIPANKAKDWTLQAWIDSEV